MGPLVQVHNHKFKHQKSMVSFLRFTYETDDFNHFDLIQEIEMDPEFFRSGSD